MGLDRRWKLDVVAPFVFAPTVEAGRLMRHLVVLRGEVWVNVQICRQIVLVDRSLVYFGHICNYLLAQEALDGLLLVLRSLAQGSRALWRLVHVTVNLVVDVRAAA